MIHLSFWVAEAWFLMDAHAFRVFKVEEMLRVAETEPRFLMDEHAFRVCEVHAFRVFEVEAMLWVAETEDVATSEGSTSSADSGF